MCNQNLWRELTPFFKEQYELIHVPIPLKTNFDEIIKSLELFLPQEPINLLGFSLGGYVASYFATSYPKRVKRLFIVGNSACSISQEEIDKRKKAIEFTQSYRFKGLSRKKVQSLLEEKNQNNENLIALIQNMYVNLGEEVYTTQITATLHRKDLFEDMLKLTLPLTFFYSKKDRLVDILWLESFAKASSQAVFITNESSSHMLPLEKPYELSTAIKKWVQF